jgi:hypothetical protein
MPKKNPDQGANGSDQTNEQSERKPEFQKSQRSRDRGGYRPYFVRSPGFPTVQTEDSEEETE